MTGMSPDIFQVKTGTRPQCFVADAFMRVYGIDLKKAGALNSAYLDAIKMH